MSSDDSQPVVLIVDDAADVHSLVRTRLRNESIQLVSAHGGHDGLARAKELCPAVILLDLDMPDMDGFEVLRALKNEPTTSNVPVIVLSGLQQSSDKVTAFDLGATDYVTKPFDFAELRARLRSALRLDSLLRLLSERAEVDGLTGVANRAAFNKRWEQEVGVNHRYGRPLTLAMLDIDHFKKVNDTFGHPAGDEVLARFARLVQAQCRNVDLVCRFGGEEFAVIMPQTPPLEAHNLAERIRQALGAVVWQRHPEHRITVSIGVAGAEAGAARVSAQQWIEAADKALYAAKHGGRNRVVMTNLDPRPTLARAG